MDALNRTAPEPADQLPHDGVDRFVVAFDTPRSRMQQILDELDEVRVGAVSGNGLVEVIVDADGMVIRTRILAEAGRSTSAELAAAFTDAARAAGVAARRQREDLLAPLAECADFADLVPAGAEGADSALFTGDDGSHVSASERG